LLTSSEAQTADHHALTLAAHFDAHDEYLRVHVNGKTGFAATAELRALTYKALVLTGLRVNELRSLTMGQADLDGPAPVARLNAADEKARRGAEIPLRADWASDLPRYVADVCASHSGPRRRLPRPFRRGCRRTRHCCRFRPNGWACLDRDLLAVRLARAVREQAADGTEHWRTRDRREIGH
jgi:hypothetical protein